MQNDYITRTIRQFARMLAALIKRRGSVTFDDLNDLSLDFTGLDLGLLRSLGTGQLISLFTVAGEVNVEKLYIAATLLYQLAQIVPDEARVKLESRVLELLIRVRGEFGDYLNAEHEVLIEQLASHLEVDI